LPFQTPVLVTLNPHTPPAPDTVHACFDYEHPVMDTATIAAQQQLPRIQGKDGIWYAGAWTGYGFHEDGLKSALRIAAAFDVAPDWMVLP
jgi:predicted NAD/FAD-binding protein